MLDSRCMKCIELIFVKNISEKQLMEFNDPSGPQARNALVFSPNRMEGNEISDLLHKGGCNARVVTDIRNAKNAVQKEEYDVVFSVVAGFDSLGMEFLKWLQDTILGIRRVGITKLDNTDLTSDVYRLGVNHCFFFHSIQRDLLAECMESMFKDENSFIWYKRRSQAFKTCAERILTEGKSRRNLFIFGESGSGKCSIARLIHHHGILNGKFVVADCVHLSNDRHAYERIVGSKDLKKTAIFRSQQGLLCQSNGGTLLVDHVEKLPLHLQEIFVSVIEEHKYYDAVTGTMRPYTGRLIFTGPCLDDLVREGTFSSRLYHTISQSVMRVPTLAECYEDILPLANAFLEEICKERNIEKPTFTKEAEEKLQRHVWSGNLRELYSAISSSCDIFHGKTIGASDLNLLEPDGYIHSEKFILKKALTTTHGNISAAGRLMGKDRTTIARNMKKYGLKREDFIKG